VNVPRPPSLSRARSDPRRWPQVGLGAFGCVLLACTGCTSVNHYNSGRLLPRRATSVVSAIEATRIDRTQHTPPFGDTTVSTRSLVLYPVLMVRHGLTDGIEGGLMAHPGRVGMELKLGLVGDGATRGPHVALLLAPALQPASAVLDAPILATVPLATWAEITASPGLAIASPLVSSSRSPSGAFVRAGVALALLLPGRLRIVPEATVSTAFIGDTRLWTTAGVGLGGDTP
jgi:hypothetical protein